MEPARSNPHRGSRGIVGIRLTAVDSAGRRKKVSTIEVEPNGVEGREEDGKAQENADNDENNDHRDHKE